MVIFDCLGEEWVNIVFKNFLEDYKFSDVLYLIMLDFQVVLNIQVIEEEQQFIVDLFECIMLYDLKMLFVEIDEINEGKI